MKRKTDKKHSRTEDLLNLCREIEYILDDIEESHKTKKYKVESMVEELLYGAARSGEYILKNMHVVLEHEGREEEKAENEY